MVVLLYFLLLFALTGSGLLGPDEPRYASIGREMALSGDWITPRLWGEPWFEKPVLLYWMTGAAFKAGLGEDLALVCQWRYSAWRFWCFISAYWRGNSALARPGTPPSPLATSAGWLAFSQIGVTDLPMTAAFAAAMLLSIPWITNGNRRLLIPAGALLGVAVLAKGLVPLILAVPLLWMGRKRLLELPRLGVGLVVVAVPWYLLCTLRNGLPFLEEFFWKHHFQRFSNDALQHVQPIWFYIPVLLAGLVPWTPLLVLLFKRRLYQDQRVRFLLLWFAFGFVFLSISVNKLPGYLLPLLPALCALDGTGSGGSEKCPVDTGWGGAAAGGNTCRRAGIARGSIVRPVTGQLARDTVADNCTDCTGCYSSGVVAGAIRCTRSGGGHLTIRRCRRSILFENHGFSCVG